MQQRLQIMLKQLNIDAQPFVANSYPLAICQPSLLLSLHDHKTTPKFNQVIDLPLMPTDRHAPKDSLRDA